MPRILQHYPNFVSGHESLEATYSNLDQLLSVDWVDHFSKDLHGNDDSGFYRYSRSEKCDFAKESYYLLMAEYQEGTKWWVIGYVYDDDDIITQLPVNPYKRKQP